VRPPESVVTNDTHDNDLAIVGMAGRFPGAQNVEEFWRNLCDGVESIRTYTEQELVDAGERLEAIRRPGYIKAGAPLDGMELFDAEFFGFSPKESAILDPQHRHFLECAWEALEDAAHVPQDFDGQIGLYGGCGMGSYFYFNLCSNQDLVDSVGMFLLRHTGNDKDFLVTRAAYLLDLKGPAVNVQTACSTSLVATHLACQSLINGECDMALAGGVTIEIPHRRGYVYRESEILSPDGHCRAFDAQAAGTVFGSGVGVVVLRRLADAVEDRDHIYAVIRGSAINNDGASKVGYLAPSVDGQAEAMAEAYAVAGVSPDDIGYIECHGTGTTMGDPIEVEALTQAFRTRTERTAFCRIGSVKTNIGHLDTAAGVASLIKTALTLHHKKMAPSLHYTAPSPNVAMDQTPFVVNDALRDWPAEQGPRIAAVNSLGVGGTNAHVVLSEAPEQQPSSEGRALQLLTLSARNRKALDGNVERLARCLRGQPELDLADVAYTLHKGRRAFDQRCVLAASSSGEATAVLESADPRRLFRHTVVDGEASVAFMFPGGGSQQASMGARLYEEEPAFREQVDHGLRRLKELCDVDLRPLWFPSDEDLESAERELERMPHQLPAIFIVEYALAQLWKSWGIEPRALIGHSVGENTAACVAGVMSFDDCLRLVHLRGVLFERVPESAMLSVDMPAEEVEPLLEGECDLAVVNTPDLCVVSGSTENVERLQTKLAERDVETRRVAVPVAAHSRMLEPILGDFRAFLESIELSPPEIPFVSNRSGTWITDAEAQDPGYWVEHLRHRVRFAEGIGTLLETPGRVLLEVGAGQTLSSLARQHPSASPRHNIIPSLPRRDDVISDATFFLTSVGRAWASGVDFELARLWKDERRRRVSLPTYAFVHKPYFLEPKAPVAAVRDVSHLKKIPSIEDWGHRETWSPSSAGALAITKPTTWLMFMDEAGVGQRMCRRLRERGHRVIVVHEGDGFLKRNEDEYTLSPERGRSGYDALVRDLMASGGVPSHVVHLWLVTEQETFRPGSSFFHRNLAVGFYSLFFLAQALADENVPVPLRLNVVSSDMQQVLGEPLPYPEKATVLGPCRVLPREMPGVQTMCIDVTLPKAERSLGDLIASVVRSVVGRARKETALDEIAAALEVDILAEVVDTVVAYREGGRYVQRFESLGLPAPPEGALDALRDGGVYLITGGTGDLGLNLAKFVARRHGAKLVLVGRRALPDRDDWDSWLKRHPINDPTCVKIRGIRAVEEAGGEVMLAVADASNLQAMTDVADAARARFGTIHGVFHTAGLVRDDLIQLKNEADIESVFSAKIHGTLVLDTLFKDESLDFMVLFSSTSAIVAPAGQVDYVAANAFLDAFACSKSSDAKTRVVSVNWGIWSDIGIAARAFSDTAQGAEIEYQPCRIEYPLIDTHATDAHGRTILTAQLSPKTHWVLDQHRTLAGEALVPGTGHVELVRAALREFGETGPFELSNLFFLRPLYVPDGETREVRVLLQHTEEGYSYQVRSECRLDGRRGFQLHAEANVRLDGLSQPPTIDVDAIDARCTRDRVPAAPEGLPSPQEAHMQFGPRWRVLRQVSYGEGEALARLSLPAEFRNETQTYGLHPALLDIATGYAMQLIADYRGAELWVPVAYGQLRAYGDLDSELVSWVRKADESQSASDFARFDVTIATTGGEVLVEVRDFTIKRMAADTGIDLTSPPARAEVEFEDTTGPAPTHERTPAERQLQRNMEQGIGPEEGTDALARVLATSTGPRVVVSSLDLDDLIEQAESQYRERSDAGVKFERPDLDSEYQAPSDDIERTLVGFWEELLGVDRVGVRDSFFDLGGHSLIAVRLFARIEKAYDVDFPISVLFEAPTIESCANMIRDAIGDRAVSEPVSERSVRRPRFKHLVAMHPRVDAAGTPFFLVAGMFGNVLNLRHLANLVGVERPFYGLQARGLYGDEPPHETFEAMANDYIGELRAVQREGPYMLGGFSGGGITAFEMARQLRESGEVVGLLVLLDTPLPQSPPLTLRDRAQIKLQELKRRGPMYFSEWARSRFEWEVTKLKERFDTNGTETIHTPDQFQNEAIETAFLEALEGYELQRQDAPLVLFRPKLDRAYVLGDSRIVSSEREWVWDDNGWSPYCTEVEIHEMPGDHDSMVLEPNVRVMAEHLRACIEEAEARMQQGYGYKPQSGAPQHTSGLRI